MALRSNEITDRTTLSVVVQVLKEDTTEKSLVGATYRAMLGKTDLKVSGVVVPMNEPKGLLKVTFPAATGMAGQVSATLHVTLAGETQCVWRERLQVFNELEPL